ncbi:MAG: D-alanyl-D-alanine carboxypeptidase/D-alanyl-D-alanine-endopeptidase [Bacteroidales bacterium]|nr:D-alanyl-D-alanine carboxypeptidase/D-alanyl-D-alanine-endopeptidase [Bacteroidales bacterium]
MRIVGVTAVLFLSCTLAMMAQLTDVGGQAGVYVVEVSSGQVLTASNEHIPLVPASTLKLVTTATALELLGPDHRFETALEYVGSVREGVLKGDLVIRGGGDPSLGSRHMGEEQWAFLETWVNQVKAAGIKQVYGHIVADASYFDEEPLSPFWLWEDIGNYYAAGVHGLGVHDNSYTLHLRSGAPGSQPIILGTEPSLPHLHVDNHLMAADNNKDSAYLYVQPWIWTRSLYGTMPANRADFSIKGDLPDPPLQAAVYLYEALKKAGISVQEPAVTVRSYPLPRSSGVRLGVVCSPPLRRLVEIILHHSDNHYAECLLRHLAAVRFAPPLTARNGLAVIQQHWQSTGLDMSGLIMVDGSGLSPVNRLSARFLGQLLMHMATRSEQSKVFEALLPRAGLEGTVSNFLANTPLAGKARLKSGSNQYTTAYAGYCLRNGSKQVVVLVVNHGLISRQQVRNDLTDFLLGR